MKYLIVGLGNIGQEYQGTRHNIGFRILDAFAEASNISFSTDRYGDVGHGRIKNKQVVLLKPSTYMNLSGNAVRYWKTKENIDLENILVLVDDLALPFGAIRMKGRGSDAGHNGLKNIAQMLGSDAYPRLRFGIGSDFPKGPDRLRAGAVYPRRAPKAPAPGGCGMRCNPHIRSCRVADCHVRFQ